jgi:hypothetical protein
MNASHIPTSAWQRYVWMPNDQAQQPGLLAGRPTPCDVGLSRPVTARVGCSTQ